MEGSPGIHAWKPASDYFKATDEPVVKEVPTVIKADGSSAKAATPVNTTAAAKEAPVATPVAEPKEAAKTDATVANPLSSLKAV